jgi:hypothetical protein
MLDLLRQRAIGQVLLRKPNRLPHSSPPRIRPACTRPSKIKLEYLVQLIILQFRQSPKPLPHLRPRIQPHLPQHLAPTPRQHLLPARRLPARPASLSFVQPLPLPRCHARPLRRHNPHPNTPNTTHQLKPEQRPPPFSPPQPTASPPASPPPQAPLPPAAALCRQCTALPNQRSPSTSSPRRWIPLSPPGKNRQSSTCSSPTTRPSASSRKASRIAVATTTQDA